MRPMREQFAECFVHPEAKRAKIFGVLTLILLSTLVNACGKGDRLHDDPESSSARSMADWQHELARTREQMTLMPQEPYWPYRAAQIQIATDSTAEARTSLKRALTLCPDYSPALLLLSKLQYQAGEFEEAAELLEPAVIGEGPEIDALRIALALNLDALGKSERAQELLRQSSHAKAMFTSAATYVNLRSTKFQDSLELAEAALKTNPHSASNQNDYGIALLYSGDPEGARAAFLKALELDPKLSGALYNLAIVDTYYFYDKRKGREWFERYAKLDSSDPDELGAVFGIELAAHQGVDRVH
jgi:tetratricopeptide (TPR) repeat protein